MDPRRLVRVATGGPQGCGSGYLVGPHLVLTALHVVRPEGHWAEQVETHVGHTHFGELERRRAQVCWPDPLQDAPPPDALDIALLWLDEPVPTTGGAVAWGRPGGTGAMPYSGAGFPAFAADAGSPAQVEDLRGELSAVSTSMAGWVLDCRIWPAPGRAGKRPWAGASGSAIFCHGRLVGVAVEDNRTMDWRRLHAAPIHKALALPDFARIVARHAHPGTSTLPEEVTADHGTAAPARPAVVWPVEVGPVPTQATAFQSRSVLRERIDATRSAGGSVVLTQVLAGGGGVGKTQLAAACATDFLDEGADLVVWAPATELQQVITQYAQAAADLQLPGATGDDPEADARALLKWLATTSRRWLVVLDDITDPATLGTWWPVSRTGTGWVLATTRLNDARLTGGGRTRIDITVYTPEESLSYLGQRLDGDRMGHLLDDQAPALAEALGHLPLALGLAAAHMLNENLTCTQYLGRFDNRATRLADALPESADTEGYGRQITVALLLSLDAARSADTTGLAVPALRLAALLDPAGHPRALWAATPLLDHLTTHRPDDTPVTEAEAHSVLQLLHRYALITYDTPAEPRALRIHALTARAVLEDTPEAELRDLAVVVAQGLVSIWPETDQSQPDFAAALRTNTDTLARHAHDHLWDSEGGRLVLYRAGDSLLSAGFPSAATAYWERLVPLAEAKLGEDHPELPPVRVRLAGAYRHAGRTQQAIALLEQAVPACERLLGPDHRDTLTARTNLAGSYQQAGRTQEAIGLLEQVNADRERLLGPDHPSTLAVRGNLATSYQYAGRTQEALTLLERVVADCERVLGHDHPNTLTARGSLAGSYQQAGRLQDAVDLLEQVTVDHRRVLGVDHPETLTARSNLAGSYQQAGRIHEAIGLLERLVTDCERLAGPDHPRTLTVRGNLAGSYRGAGRTHEAVDGLERLLADCERILGPDHPNTLSVRGNLASSYQQAGHTQRATALLEQVAADHERLLGHDHPSSLTARGNLANSYQQAGHTRKAIDLLEQAVADAERILGHDHPETLTARSSLANSYQQGGHTQKSIDLLEGVAADRDRLLGSDHPSALTTLGCLANSYYQAGRTQEAVDLLEQVAADHGRLLGGHHPDTLIARSNLASGYQRAGRIQQAVDLVEQVAADSQRLLGPHHPNTLTTLANLAGAYQHAGHTQRSIDLLEQVSVDSERLLGAHHPETLKARGNLAASYQQSDRTWEAIALLEHVVADCERNLGVHHPETLAARGNLAGSYQEAGRTWKAIALMEQVAADCARVLGHHHPNSLTARANLAGSYHQAGRIAKAVTLMERVTADCLRILGPEHPGTLTARGNLAIGYSDAGSIHKGLAMLEKVVADCERILGPDHPGTVRARTNLIKARQRRRVRRIR
ncbi:FxSxx-COOH system tetratricopeptide repeat protein [Streptomyces sp. NPDC059534]|uniref:FxSxx-COOH system tetratricopeptide repeat protein n=1 Tax=Streptomyces sp. NPDC059534 TaxID=3346859 RepID=UPI0036B2B598